MMPKRSRRSSQSSGGAWLRKDGKINYSEFVAMMKKGTGSTETTNPKKRRDLPDGSTLRFATKFSKNSVLLHHHSMEPRDPTENINYVYGSLHVLVEQVSVLYPLVELGLCCIGLRLIACRGMSRCRSRLTVDAEYWSKNDDQCSNEPE